jgi:hypothetical protein
MKKLLPLRQIDVFPVIDGLVGNVQFPPKSKLLLVLAELLAKLTLKISTFISTINSLVNFVFMNLNLRLVFNYCFGFEFYIKINNLKSYILTA